MAASSTSNHNKIFIVMDDAGTTWTDTPFAKQRHNYTSSTITPPPIERMQLDTLLEKNRELTDMIASIKVFNTPTTYNNSLKNLKATEKHFSIEQAKNTIFPNLNPVLL
jgi:hypothetical protein